MLDQFTFAHIGLQVLTLFLLALPIACIAWTVTHEEVFREPRDYCAKRSQHAPTLLRRKFFYLFTCEYCFSYYVTIFFLVLTRYKLLFDDWRGYLVSLFSLVYVANFYMGGFGRLRLEIKQERLENKQLEAEVEKKQDQLEESKRRAA